MARKREDMVSDLVDSYTTRELKALVKMLGASDPWASVPVSNDILLLPIKRSVVASAIKAKLFDPTARTQMHEPKGED